MASKKQADRNRRGWSKLEEKYAGSIGPGFERDPRKGTENPFTAHLKPARSEPSPKSNHQ